MMKVNGVPSVLSPDPPASNETGDVPDLQIWGNCVFGMFVTNA